MNKTFISFFIFFSLILFSCSKKSSPNTIATTSNIYSNNPYQKSVDSLLSLMTLEEKIGQLQQLSANISRADLPQLIEETKVGSILNEIDPETVTRYQKIALEKSRLGIPLLIGRDVIHGFRTMFPIPLAQSATWNMDLIEQGAQIAATEASSKGINWTFAPMIDVSRDPRWGRIAESPGEDPYLTSQVGAAMIRGFQGNGSYVDGNIAACAKHFAAYGVTEGGRDYTAAHISERMLREIYLRPFKEAIDQGAMSFMTAFNEVNDIPATGSELLLKTVLREEWHYDGMVVSDWAAIVEMKDHGYCKDDKDAAFKAMRAGVDMEMVTTTYRDYMAALVREHKIGINQLDHAVGRILLMKYKLGLFKNPYPVSTGKELLHPDHLRAARQAAAEAIVLLKNKDNLLPLSQDLKSVAVIGPMAHAPHDQLGTWSFDGKKADAQTPLIAIQKEWSSKMDIHYAPGLDNSRSKTNDGFKAAIQAANKSEVILYFVGEEAILSGEAHSRAHLNLPGSQEDLLDKLHDTGKPIIMIVIAGRPLILKELLPKTEAVLYAWQGGTMAGPAIVDILSAKTVPSGKLPVTFPTAVGQIPMYHAHKNTGRPADFNTWTHIDSIPVEAWQTSLGNRSHHLDEGFLPLFPFGFGLSYTQFDYSKVKLDQTSINNKEKIIASVKLSNTGDYDAQEVVQLYIQDEVGSVTRPVKELKDFKKIFLKAGASKTVKFEITADDLAYTNADMIYGVEPGSFKLWIAPHSQTTDFVKFNWVE